MKEQLSVVAVAVGIAVLFALGGSVLIHKHARDNAAAQAALEAPPPQPVAIPTVPPVQPLPVIAAAPLPVTPETPKTSRAFERAKQLVLDGRDAEARHVLEPRVRRGAGSVDEARLLKELCKRSHDQSCIDDIKTHYPNW